MRLYFIFCFALLMSFGCTLDEGKNVNLENFEYRTYDDTELFFKNIRQSYYNQEELKHAKLNVFRVKTRNVSDSIPVLNLAIVMNWVKDESYILLEPNAYINDNASETIEIKWHSGEGVEGEWVLETSNKEGMLKLASNIYHGIINKYRFSLVTQLGEVPLLSKKREIEAFRITMSDYYRLTRLY